MLDLSKPLLTRDGREVRILDRSNACIRKGVAYPICAEVESDRHPGMMIKHWYTREGLWDHEKAITEFDLVNYPWTPRTVEETPVDSCANQRWPQLDARCLMHYAIGMISHDIAIVHRHMGVGVPRDMLIPRGEDTYQVTTPHPRYVLTIPMKDERGHELPPLRVNVTNPDEVMQSIIQPGYLDNVWIALREVRRLTPLWETTWSRYYANVMDKTIEPTTRPL